MTTINLTEDVLKLKFIKYRTKWAHGPSFWSFEYFSPTSTVEDFEEFVQEKSTEYCWSDRFRGVEWEEIIPDAHIIDRFIRNIEGSIVDANRRLADLKAFKEAFCKAEEPMREHD